MNIRLLPLSKRKPETEDTNGGLPVLPLFHNIQHKSALVAGNGDAAAWKVELLARAGAQVHLYASRPEPGICGRFRELVRTGQVILYRRKWLSRDLDGHCLAICDAAGAGEAARFVAAAKQYGVPYNVIDRAEYCSFQFGSIVNRGPVVLGISTSGTMPVLAQRLRVMIEKMLPTDLGDWARMAGQWRTAIAARLPEVAARRTLWGQVADLALSGRAANDDQIAALVAGADGDQGSAKGRVTLVGAGPGDAELLTLKAVRALQSADVVLYDNLVSDDVLDLARREARKMPVGKRGGRPSCSQSEINRLMLHFARQGKHVVRLKGGDPMIFGRAGEEISRLQQVGISVDVVPGITTALAMASSLGVSLTHRDCAQSVRFVTAHRRDGKLPDDLDWQTIADPNTTTIFYMGGRTAAQISQHLRAHGLSGDTPVVIGKSVSRPGQLNWYGKLDQLADGMTDTGYDQPVIIGVGAVFAGVCVVGNDADSHTTMQVLGSAR